VNVHVVNGYLAIQGSGEIHSLRGTKFPLGKYTPQRELEQLNSYLSALFRKQRLFEMIRPAPTSGTAAPSVPPAAASVSGASMNEGLANLKKAWPECPQCDISFVKERLGAILGNLKMKSDTPLIQMFAEDADKSILAFDVEPPASGLKDPTILKIRFDLGAAKLDTDGKLQKGAAVRKWIVDNFEGRFWNASKILTHFNGFYQAIGLNPTVIVSLAGQSPRSVAMSESSRIGGITFPGDGHGKIDPNADKLAYLLLRSDQWRTFPSAKLGDAGDGLGFQLCLPILTRGKCTDYLPDGDDTERSLDYLSAFWLAERTADLQALGYGVAAVNELKRPSDPGIAEVTRTPAIDLKVQKLASSAGAVPSGKMAPASPAPSPASADQSVSNNQNSAELKTTAELPRPPVSSSVGAAAQKPGTHETLEMAHTQIAAAAASRIDPVAQGTTLPALKNWHAEYGVALQYRPNQAVRVLAAAQTTTLELGQAIISASGQAGTDGTHPLGNGNINADWLWFDKIRRRLEFQLTGSTDVTSKRILGGSNTDERRVGGNAHAQLELFRDIRGVEWNVFVDPRRETVSLTRSGVAAGGGNLSTMTVGSRVLYDLWTATAPMRFALNSQTRVGVGLGAGEPVYNIFDVDGGIHQRISNQYLISADISGRFQAASKLTPVFELPSLGGGDSVRGFQMDDALGRKMWSLQSEIWTPLPFTLDATEGSAVRWFLRRNVRAAAFFDAGAVSDTSLTRSPGLSVVSVSSEPGLRKGTGAGIRFVQGPIALKLDWAYGFGRGVFGEGHGRFYLGVSRNGTF
jgi:hypothetical protein